VVAFVSTPCAGRTTVCLNLVAAAAATGRKAMVLDCAGELGVPDPAAAADEGGVRLDGIRDWMVLEPLAIVAGPSVEVVRARLTPDAAAQFNAADQTRFGQALRQLGARADLVFLDPGCADAYWIGAADEVVLVMRADPDSVVDGYRYLKRLHTQTRLNHALVVINCVENQAHVGRIFGNLCATAERFLQLPLELLGWIPLDDCVSRSAGLHRPCVEAFPQSPAAAAARVCAAALAERESHREGSIDPVAHRLAGAARSIITT